MPYETVKTSITNYLSAILDRLTPAPMGNQGDALFINNEQGFFSFDSAPPVSPLGIVTTQGELDHSRELVEQSGTAVQLYDLRDETLHEWDGFDWTITTTPLSEVLVFKRLYISPYTQKVFLYDTTGVVEQLRESM